MLKELHEIKVKMDELETEYKKGLENAERQGIFEEKVDGRIFKLIISQGFKDIIEPTAFYEKFHKAGLAFMTVKVGEAKKAFGEEKISPLVSETKPYISRYIKVK
jgi:hypothetical protein